LVFCLFGELDEVGEVRESERCRDLVFGDRGKRRGEVERWRAGARETGQITIREDEDDDKGTLRKRRICGNEAGVENCLYSYETGATGLVYCSRIVFLDFLTTEVREVE
jgi:hypothetical protein